MGTGWGGGVGAEEGEEKGAIIPRFPRSPADWGMLFAKMGNTKQGTGFREWGEEMNSCFGTTEFKVPIGYSGVELRRKMDSEEKRLSERD